MLIQGTNKYLNDLFYVGPLYHQIFTNLEKLIFLDVGKNWNNFFTIFNFVFFLDIGKTST